jgi:hypothetical protein
LLVLLLIALPIANKNWLGSKINLKNDNPVENQESENSQKLEPKKNNLSGLPVMLKPNFFGNDDNGNPFNISANSGVSLSEDKIVLSDLNADMLLKDKSKIKISSYKGDYLNKQKRLVLNSGVIIVTDKDYQFKTNSAVIKLNDNTATGSEKVYIKGAIGDIEANGFIIRNTGDEIVLFGGINLSAKIDDEDFNKLQQIKK